MIKFIDLKALFRVPRNATRMPVAQPSTADYVEIASRLAEALKRELDYKKTLDSVGKLMQSNIRLQRELAEWKAAAGFCEKHQPTGGTRNCLVCGCEQLSFALDRICRMIEDDPECSSYGLHQDPDLVVQQVSLLLKKPGTAPPLVR